MLRFLCLSGSKTQININIYCIKISNHPTDTFLFKNKITWSTTCHNDNFEAHRYKLPGGFESIIKDVQYNENPSKNEKHSYIWLISSFPHLHKTFEHLIYRNLLFLHTQKKGRAEYGTQSNKDTLFVQTLYI